MSPRRWPDRAAVLFDLDGTLVDTAADLCAAANSLRAERGMSALALSRFRPWVSRGGKAMLEVAFPDMDEAQREALLPEFLRRYGEHPAIHSGLFPGMKRVLSAIEARGLRWGVVTNKPIGLAAAVVRGLALAERCAVLLGGDSLPTRKPDPLSLLTACEQLAVAPELAIYVGDDQRDVQAAHAAGMPALAVAWGYIAPGESISDWNADRVVAQPVDLIDALALEP